jgi:circadian clock protein KaiB
MNSTAEADKVFEFKLYIVKDAPKSLLAIANLNALCNQHMANNYHIEIVDVLHDPQQALDEGILLTPTLVRLKPAPVLRIAGTMENVMSMLQILGLGA